MCIPSPSVVSASALWQIKKGRNCSIVSQACHISAILISAPRMALMRRAESG